MARTFVVYDPSARFTHIAEAIADPKAKVLYVVQHAVGFPQPVDMLPGQGLDGIDVRDDLFEALEEADCLVMPDVGDSGLAEFMRARGLPVFGSGAAGCLETDRWHLRRVCKAAGIGVPDGEEIRGIDALRDYLEECDEGFVKINKFRGATETFKHKSQLATREKLRTVAERLGAFGPYAEFTVEQPVGGNDDCVEVGIDTFFANGMWPETVGWGYEVKDAAFLSTTAELPPRLRAFCDRFANVLSAYDYRGPFSNELRITEDDEYLIDNTMRCGSPPSQLQCLQIGNLRDVIWGVANGIMVEPQYVAPYGVQINLTSEAFQAHPLALEIEHPERVMVFGHCRLEDHDFAINTQAHLVENLVEFGAACGVGDTLEEAVEAAIEAAEGVDGLYVSFNVGKLDEAMETVRTGERLGLQFGTHMRTKMED
jgi:hypothetical protein